ncbi:hypothetical protein LEP1GSC104_1492 [Leptospira interrogans str. UI 12621]|uniref:Uncharacterized protein n=1 Tax=Leptospira interrogans str. UI 12621 TaxID=1049937 RepID=A0A0F6H402_LEPIR|nr:hypothetical protein LEP1GSC104_1492 [Leptospira interrogans str. UI 12621]
MISCTQICFYDEYFKHIVLNKIKVSAKSEYDDFHSKFAQNLKEFYTIIL